MTSPVRIALIGCGRIAQVAHLPALEKADGVALVALCDPSEPVARALARRYDVATVYTSHTQAYADPKVEAVLIAAPDRFHYALAVEALRADKHVLVEKPLAATVEEGTQLVALVAQRGRKLQVGAMKRHDPGLEFARDFIATSLGAVRSFNAWYRIGTIRPGVEATLFPKTFTDERVRQVEAEYKADRGRYLLATHGAHLFDMLRFLLGDVRAVTALHRSSGHDHAWQLLLTLASGAIGTAALTVDVPGDGAEGFQVFGADGQLTAQTHFPFFRRASDVHAYSTANGTTTAPLLADTDPYERQLEAFARAIRADGDTSPNAADGLAALRLIDAVDRSVATTTEVIL